MKRWGLVLVLAAGLASPAAAQGSLPQPIYFWGNTAAMIRGPRLSPLPEVVRPSAIVLFADGSWAVDHLRWSHWGASTASATGTSSASNGNPSQAQGKRITAPATVTLSDPGRFYGREVYRCFRLTVRAHAASDLHLCLKRAGGFWYFGSALPPTPPPAPRVIDFLDRSITGGCELTTTRVVCETYATPGQTATLNAAGTVTMCTQRRPSNRCAQGDFGEHTPAYTAGRRVTLGPFGCRLLAAGVRCTVTATGRGFEISRTRMVRVT